MITNHSSLHDYCDADGIECQKYNAPIIYTDIFRWILWVNWLISLLMTVGGITYMFSKWVTIKILVKDWPYNMVVYRVPMKKLKGIIPLPLIKFGLFLKLVPSLVVDVVDILFDTLYFTELVSDNVLDPNIHIKPHVYIIIFAFQITGTIKNAILVTMAIKKLTPKSIHNQKDANSVLRTEEMDEDESLLRDTNGYMYITFLQTILAFLMQDAPEAITQYFYVDKYLQTFNPIVVAACCIRFFMSLRVVYIYFIYVKSFIDPAYHSLKVRCMLWSMVFVKFIIFTAHGIRSVAVVKANSETVKLTCFESIDLSGGKQKIEQEPWNMDCMDGVDFTLLILSGLSILGVFVGVIAMSQYGEKVYNQSHYTGRTGMVSVGKELTLALKVKRKLNRKQQRFNREEQADCSENENPRRGFHLADRSPIYRTSEL